MDAYYRKYNDRSLNSSTYHKKDGTNIHAKLKVETQKEIQQGQIETKKFDIHTAKCGEKYVCSYGIFEFRYISEPTNGIIFVIFENNLGESYIVEKDYKDAVLITS